MAEGGRLTDASHKEAKDELLPEYSDPPVDETVLAIQFAPIQGFGIPHFGLYWERIRERYPSYEVQQPIPSVTEQMAPHFRSMQIGFQLVATPELRCWYVDKSGNQLFQLQRDRFMFNWRRVKGDEPYPRYQTLCSTLKEEWLGFRDFLKSENLEAPQVNQCEVTYVNNIEYDNGWSGYGELHKVINAWAEPPATMFLPVPERVNLEAHYRWNDDAGRLHVSLQPVLRARDGKEVLQMTLVARGAPRSLDDDGVFDCLDHCRKWVVKGFADFTTKTIQTKIWGRK